MQLLVFFVGEFSYKMVESQEDQMYTEIYNLTEIRIEKRLALKSSNIQIR